MRRFTTLLALFAIIFIPPHTPVQAQQNAPSAKLSSRTNVVLVPVIVTDKHGNHIRGLSRDDFEIKEGGAVQKIASFEEIVADSKPVPRADLPPNAFSNLLVDDHPKQLEIIALDLLNTPFTAQADARRGLIEFLSKSVDQNALLALVIFHSNRVTLIHNFTTDPSILVSAVRKLQAHPTSRDLPTAHVYGDDDVEAAQLNTILVGAAADMTSLAGAKVAVPGIAARMDASRQDAEGLVTLECFQQVAQFFAAVPGRKSLVWASAGFNLGTGAAMMADQFRGSTAEDWQRTVHMLQDANIAVYPVDVGGLVMKSPNIQIAVNMPVPGNTAEGGVGARSAAMEAATSGRLQDPTQSKHETMRVIADATGGQPFYNNNDLENLFRRASQDFVEYYMLSYSTNDTAKNGWRKLDVRVHRDSVQVRSRSGFFFSNLTRNPEASREVDESLALTSSLNFSALPISGSWQQIELAGDNRKVHFSLTLLAGAVTIDTDHENHLNLDFLAVATDPAGHEAARISQRLERNLPPAAVAQIQATGVTYANVLTLAPASTPFTSPSATTSPANSAASSPHSK